MKRRVLLSLLFCALAFSCALSQAQGVFVTQGENGPVFSDKPQPGGKEVTLKPLNVVPLPKPDKTQPAAIKAEPVVLTLGADATAYQRFAVVYPEDNGSIVTNTAVFDVRVAVEPALKLGDGHAIVVSLNGRPVGQRFTTTEFMIPPEFWGDSLPPPDQAVQLDASIVDANNQVLKAAAPVRFILRYAIVINHVKRPPGQIKPPRPHRPPQPVTPPKPREMEAALPRKSDN